MINFKPIQKISSASLLTWMFVIVFIAQNTSTVLVGRYTRRNIKNNNQDELYEVHHMIFTTEVFKFIVSSFIEFFNHNFDLNSFVKSIRQHFWGWDFLRISLPAILYYFQNILVYYSLSYISAPLFQVIYQSKLVTTTFLSVLMLQRNYSLHQWCCVIIKTIGVAVVMADQTSSSETEVNRSKSTIFGVGLVFLACFFSSLAGVYFEKVLKKKNSKSPCLGEELVVVSLWVRNMQLSIFSLIVAVIQDCYSAFNENENDSSTLTKYTTRRLFFAGFTAWVWVQVLLLGAGGLLVAIVTKRTSSVAKGLATGVSVVLSSLMSYGFWKEPPMTVSFILGSIMILSGAFFFHNPIPYDLSMSLLFANRIQSARSIYLAYLIVGILTFQTYRFGYISTQLVTSTNKTVFIHPEQFSTEGITKPGVLPVPSDIHSRLLFHIYDSNSKNKNKCGGCKALKALSLQLHTHGFHATLSPSCPDPEIISFAKKENRTVVVIYPEVIKTRCTTDHDAPPIVHVRWILAPLGTHTPKTIAVEKYGAKDLLFYYGTGFGPPGVVGPENVLQIVENPKPGDETDLLEKDFYNKERYGIALMMRKGPKFHSPSWMKHLQNQREYKEALKNHNVTNLPRDISSVRNLLWYEYFVTYDPYTYWSWLAGMSGAVSVVHPVENMTKQEWAMGTFMGAYMKAMGLEDFPGIAYGWEKSEIDHARQTMGQLRPFLLDLKQWGEQVTVPRMARDCYRYALYGARTNFEGALVNENVYKRNAEPSDS